MRLFNKDSETNSTREQGATGTRERDIREQGATGTNGKPVK